MTTSTEADLTATRPLFETISAAEAEVNLGPLAPLVGTWRGAGGWNLIAVPAPPLPKQSQPRFTLLIEQIIDTIVFKPILALVPNRGGLIGIMKIPGLYYEQTVYQQSNPTQLMHIENGMWLLMPLPQPPMPGTHPPKDWVPQIARMSTIPHGNSLVAVGEVTERSGGPVIPTNSALPEIGQVQFIPGYLDPYLFGAPIKTDDVNNVLRGANEDVPIRHTTTLDVSTANGGGIANIPFIQANADARNFKGTFWIETLQAASQPTRLQYSQQVDLFFISRLDGQGLVKWPHITVSTLTKQA
jgi:hypothetical protein